MKNLGKRAKDKVTGYEGIIIGKTKYLYGCDCYGIQSPIDKEGNLPDPKWFDEGRIEITGNGVEPKDVQADRNGGMGVSAPNNRVR